MNTLGKVAIGAVVVLGGVWGLNYIIKKKTSVGNTGPSSMPPPSQTAPPAGTPATNQVYTNQANATIRSSPHINDGFATFFSNTLATIPAAAIWTGTWTGAKTADTDGAINPATSAPYQWYAITLAPFYAQYGSSPAYMREDYITVK